MFLIVLNEKIVMYFLLKNTNGCAKEKLFPYQELKRKVWNFGVVTKIVDIYLRASLKAMK